MATLGKKELKTLERIGDIMLPGDENFPSYSALGCVENVPALAAEADLADIADLAVFLGVLAYMPNFVLRLICALLMRANAFPEFVAVPLRQLNIALRGMVISPYFANLHGENYNGKTPHEIIGFSLTRLEN